MTNHVNLFLKMCYTEKEKTIRTSSRPSKIYRKCIWAALIPFCSSEEIISYIGRSKTFQKKVLQNLPSNCSHNTFIQSPLELSARVLHDGGLIPKVKYRKMRDADTMKSMSVNSLQAVLPYK